MSVSEEWLRPIPREIEAWLHDWKKSVRQDLPTRVFHYTDACGLQGIVNSGELWATHVSFVNDSQEFKFANRIIDDVFEKLGAASSCDNLDTLHLAYLEHSSLLASPADPYVVCFCSEGNLLSQWRAYAANGQGFALGFEPTRLRETFTIDDDVNQNIDIFRVIYDEYEQRQWVEKAIHLLLAAMDTYEPEQVRRFVPLVFSEMSLCFKHNAFREEKEWRLVFMPRSAKFLNVRISCGQMIPYARFRIWEQDKLPPFVSITHGPTLDSQNTVKALEILLRKTAPKYWSEIEISGSDAPLRSR